MGRRWIKPLLTLLLVSAPLQWAQGQITLNSHKTQLRTVIQKIKQQTKYEFFLDDKLANSTVPAIKVNNASIQEVLSRLLAGKNVTYRIEGNVVYLKKKEAQRPSAPAPQQPRARAASRKVSGTVTDDDGNAIIGASVRVDGSNTGTVTDASGNFSLSSPVNGKISVSYLGFETKTVKLSAGVSTYNITLKEDENSLNEVVVVGYGTQKKINLTGAVDQINSDALKNRPSSNIVKMLEGQIPNLNITFADGKPGRSATMNVRGIGSINGGSALVLIDGVEGDASMVNPSDVESVTVLKDAASAAIYGARAPYGVILITTKQATKGKPKIEYNSEYTIETPQNIPDLVTDGYEWAEHYYEARMGYYKSAASSMNKTQPFSTAWLEEYKNRHDTGNFGTVVSDGSIGSKNSYVYYPEGTDWYDLLYKDHVFSTAQNLSISGSDGKFDYYMSGRYYKYSGIFNSPTQTDKYARTNFRAKAGYQATSWLKVSNDFSYGYNKYYNPMTYTESDGIVWRNINDEAHPSEPMFNPDGTLTASAVYGGVGDLLYGKSGRDTRYSLMKNTSYVDLSFLNNTLRFHGDFTFSNSHNNVMQKQVKTPYAQSVDAYGESIMIYTSGNKTQLSKTWTKNNYISANIYGEFEKTFSQDHYFKAMAGWNYDKSKTETLYDFNTDLLTDDVTMISLSTGTTTRNMYNTYSAYQFAGFFQRLNYSYKNRYLIEYDGRLDGSSRFPADKRWNYFPSASAGWRITEEPWFKVSNRILSNAKLRFSIGSLGNANGLSNYQYKQIMSVVKSGYILDGTRQNYVSAPGAIPASLTWEKATTYDGGIDLLFFNNRLSFTGDYYIRNTKGMITAGPTVPDVFGTASPRGNYADLRTYGWEMTLKWESQFKLADKPFHYSVRATLADHYSVIKKFNNATKSLSTYNDQYYAGNFYEGMRLGEIWGFVCNGLYQNQEEIDADMAKAKAAGKTRYNTLMQNSKDWTLYPGDVKIEDLDGNGYIDRGKNTVDDPGDRKIIGNSEARYIYSFGGSADWNGLHFSIFFQGVGKQDWYPSAESMFWGQYNREYNQMPKWMLNNYWTADNPDAYLPRYASRYKVFYKGTVFANTRYLQNVAYLRLKNIQVGYDLPASWIRPLHLSRVNIYFSGENLFTWSPLYKRTKDFNVSNIYGSDGDMNAAVSYGDGNNYPMMKSFSFGLNVSF